MPSTKQVYDATEWPKLLTAARDGDDVALNEVWIGVRDYLLLAANDIGDGLKGKFDASDIVQQSLIEAHRDFDGFRGHSEHEFRAWLTRLVRRNLIDAGRQFRNTKQRDVSLERPIEAEQLRAPDKTASSICRRQEVDEELLREIARLPERSQQILELRHSRGFSHAEIAQELGLTEAASRKLWSRTVDELKHRLVPENATTPRRQDRDS